jgi:3-oxoadipate enol-lactonase
VSLYYKLDGQAGGPVLALASSLGTTHAMWEPQVPALGRRHCVLRYDHPGHGDSPAGPASIEGLARAVLGLLDELGLERVAFCGISLGGMVGMWLGANAPERVERLVLCCTAPRLPPPEFWQERADTVRAHGVDAVADVVVERWFTPRFRVEQAETVRRYRQMLAETQAEGYARCCEAIRDMDLRPDLGRIAAPTTVILGAQDPVVPDESRRALASIPGSRVVVLDAAHLVNVEQPSAFTAALLATTPSA